MGKKRKIASAAHIKRNTAGTSNEISFSVLDAAKMEIEGQAKETSKKARLGRVSLFTLSGKKKSRETPKKESELPLSTGVDRSLSGGSGEGGTPAVVVPAVDLHLNGERGRGDSSGGFTQGAAFGSSSEYEIARRKSRRRLHRILAISFVSIISLAIIAVVAVYAVSAYQERQIQVNDLKDAITEVSVSDTTLVELDALITGHLDPSQKEALQRIQGDLPDIKNRLSIAKTELAQLMESMESQQDKEIADSTLKSIDARLDLIEQSKLIVDSSLAAITAIESVSSAWDEVLAADELVREAVSLSIGQTADDIASSKQKMEQALSGLERALSLYASAETILPSLDLSQSKAYVSKRIEALGHAIASDAAFLAEKPKTALSENEKYNAADAEAALLAQELPTDPVKPVFLAFEAVTSEAFMAYEEAQKQAASTDAVVRAYMGL